MTESDLQTYTATIPTEQAGRRFDAVLAGIFSQFSRERLARWITARAVTLNGLYVLPRTRVIGGEVVTLRVEHTPCLEAEAEEMALDVLYEDADVLVLNKPASLVVHPGAGNATSTLVNGLLHRYPDTAKTLPRAGIVHRLDKDTSGVMVVALNLESYTELIRQFAARGVHRRYLAVVTGALVAGGHVEAPIGRHPRDRLRMAVRADGRFALTHYRLQERFRAHSAVECRLETGRTHQIRVHMASIKYPLVGDRLYGGPVKLPRKASPKLQETLRYFPRQALHAQVLTFVHPVHKHAIEISAPIPDDLIALMAALREDAKIALDEECNR